MGWGKADVIINWVSSSIEKIAERGNIRVRIEAFIWEIELHAFIRVKR